MADQEPIKFDAAVVRVKTMVDGGIRVELDLSEKETMVMAQLAECQRFGMLLHMQATITNKSARGREHKVAKKGDSFDDRLD
jgi:hypothetical protein